MLPARLSLRIANMTKNASRTFRVSAPTRSFDLPPGYVEDPSAPAMLRFEESLPRLPVPTLSSTGANYLETVKPHLTPAEFEHTQNVVKSFVQSDLGKKLQERLKARAADPDIKNWLADWWNDVAYMAYRDPVVVYVSYFYVHMDDLWRRDQVTRAASLVKAMLPFRAMVESGSLEPEKVRGAPLSMSSYKWLFHSSRYPTNPADIARKFDASKNNHVVFLRKNKFFEVPLMYNGIELSEAELQVQIERIIQLAGDEPGVSIGALTSQNRDIWTEAHKELIGASEQNGVSLERIESAMIVVCLDDTAPVTRKQTSWACWVGDGKNRFYDKHQLIVFENGKSGFLGEHSCMDGTPTLRMNEFILGSLAAKKVDLGHPRTPETGKGLPAPTELKFVVNETIHKTVKDAEIAFDNLIGQHDMHVLHYEGYGKDYIKKFKVSPDAWAQLVKQLAFHKMFGRPGVCYESAQTRKYQFGRTEVIRSASSESKAWAEAMMNPRKTDTHRAALFKQAITRHIQYSAWASDGFGVDRHFFGLKKMLMPGEEVPEIYTDEAFSKTNHWELSTSQLSSRFLDGWGYGEVVPDGYGLSYSIGDHYIRWTITSLKRGTEELGHYLAEAATETRRMMEKAAAAEMKEAAKL